MSKASHKDFTCLLNIIDSIEKIKKYSSLFKSADDLFNESKSFDAIMMNFMIIGEMAEKLNRLSYSIASKSFLMKFILNLDIQLN
jgi:uncharacterized protein with HEPN domain